MSHLIFNRATNREERWVSVESAAERLDVSVDAVHRRIKEGLIATRLFGNEGARPHVLSDDVDRMVGLGGLPHADLEDVEAGKAIAQPKRWLRRTPGGALHAYVATRVVRIGRAPTYGSGPGSTSIAGDLPPERWRVVGPGDLLDEDELEYVVLALASGAIVELPANRGVIAELLEARKTIARLERELAEKTS